MRLVTTPVAALAGAANTFLIIANTDGSIFGVVSLIASVAILLPFADLGVGAPLTTAVAEARATGVSARQTYTAALSATSGVAGLVISCVVLIGFIDGWGVLVGQPIRSEEGWWLTVSVALFAVSVPLGLGSRLLVGQGRNDLAIAFGTLGGVLALFITCTLALMGADGLVYAIASTGGLMLTNAAMTALGLRLGRELLRPVSRKRCARVLSGSGWMLVVSVSLPIGLQWGRIVVAQFGTPDELGEYGLAAQLYGIAWGVVGAVGLGLWPAFVQRRVSHSDSRRLWIQGTMACTAVGVLAGAALTLLGPWAADVLSGGEVSVDRSLISGFGLLLAAQGAHLTSGMLLTRPSELLFQAICHLAMATLSLGGATLAALFLGVSAVPWSAAIAVVLCCVLPDLLFVESLLRKRSVDGLSKGVPEEGPPASRF